MSETMFYILSSLRQERHGYGIMPVSYTHLVNCGASLESSRTAVALAEAYPYVYAAVGVHPEEVKGVPEDYLEQLERLAAKPKVVAVGEIGPVSYTHLDVYKRQSQRFVR